MKKQITAFMLMVTMVFTLLPATTFAETEVRTEGESIEINTVNFPDENFRQKIKEKCDVNDDGILTEEEIKACTELDVSQESYDQEGDIIDLTGIEVFTSLERLDCSQNEITKLPNLPESLTLLECSYNELTALPDLPDGLATLVCVDNELTGLPELPGTLVGLTCGGNKLTNLPQLPNGLENLSCRHNQLTSLPSLPATLKTLDCYYNKIQAIPELPRGLERLECSTNQITILPELPDTLIELSCAFNRIKGILDVSALHNMEHLSVVDNEITGVILSPTANYISIGLRENCMTGLADVVGRSDIPWGDKNGQYEFNPQKAYCEFPGKTHVYGAYTIVTKATFGKNGEKRAACRYCGGVKKEVIAAIATPVLSHTAYAYDGKTKKPSVTLKNIDGIVLKNGTDYTISYAAGRKNVGKYSVKVVLKGASYIGNKSVTFKVNPKGVKFSKLSKAKKSFAAKWERPSSKYRKQMTGYQIRYSTSSKMTKAKTVTIKNTKATTKKIRKLKAKKKYYVQIRTYKTVKGVKYYSSWSKAKSVKTK